MVDVDAGTWATPSYSLSYLICLLVRSSKTTTSRNCLAPVSFGLRHTQIIATWVSPCLTSGSDNRRRCMLQMGYGARALQALELFYRGEYFNLDESEAVKGEYVRDDRVDQVRCIGLTGSFFSE